MGSFAAVFTLYVGSLYLIGHFIEAANIFDEEISSLFSVQKYVFVFSIYIALVPLMYVLGDQARKFVLLCGSLALATILLGVWSWTLFAGALLFYPVTYLRIKASVKLILCFILYLVFMQWAIGIYSDVSIFVYAFIFAITFPVRYILFFHYNALNDFKKESILDYLNYIFFPAYFIIQPHILILPKYDYFTKSFTRGPDFIRTSIEGLKHFIWGLAFSVIAVIMLVAIEEWFVVDMNTVTLKSMFINYFAVIVIICSYGNLLLGMVKGLGFNIRSPFDRPILSSNVIEFFSRTLFYFKEFIMTVFYFPLLILTKSLNRYASILISTVGAVMMGGTLYSFLELGIKFCTTVGIPTLNFPLAPERNFYVFDVPIIEWLGARLLGTLTVGLILALQQIYNHQVAYSGPSSVIKKIDQSFFAKVVKIFILITVIGYLYL